MPSFPFFFSAFSLSRKNLKIGRLDPFLTNNFSRTLTLVSGPSIKSANMCLDEGTMALEIIDDKLCSSAVIKKTARKYSLCGCYLRAADIIKIYGSDNYCIP